MDMDFDDLEMDEPEEADERQNRGFIILVAAMSGMLLIGIIAFCAWVVIVGRGYLGGTTTAADTPTPPMVTEVGGAEATLEGTPTESVEPTPAPSLVPTVTRTPTAIAQTVSPMPVETPTPRAAATLTVTATPPADSSTPETGIGALAAIGAALGLVALLALVRRLRAAH